MEKTKEKIETLDEDKAKEKCSCDECNCKDEKKEYKQKENKKVTFLILVYTIIPQRYPSINTFDKKNGFLLVHNAKIY